MLTSSIVKFLAATTCLVCVSAAGAATASGNLLTNGDFATGDLTGWTLNAPGRPTEPPYIQVTNNFTRGCFSAAYYCFYTKVGTPGDFVDLSQSFHSKAGSPLTIDFHFLQQVAGPTNPLSFSVVLDGTTLGTFTNTSFVVDQLVALHALSTGNDTLDFKFAEFQGLGAQAIGGVSVSVPEPASWALMITGFGLTGASLRRRAPKAV